MPVPGALELALLAVAGVLAGAVNAVAGGGSLVSFPVLIALGYSPLAANVTNAVAVLPGYVSGSLAYRRELAGQRSRALGIAATCALGAVAGAALLLVSPPRLFERLVPFLVLSAVVLLAAQPLIERLAGSGAEPSRERRSPRLHALAFLASLYGGYFSVGLGLVLLAALALSLRDDLGRLNALKGLLSLLIGVVSAVYLALFGPVAWAAVAAIAAGNAAGGPAGVLLARRMGDRTLRTVVVALGLVVTAWLFFEL